jgi:hypothetical protein
VTERASEPSGPALLQLKRRHDVQQDPVGEERPHLVRVGACQLGNLHDEFAELLAYVPADLGIRSGGGEAPAW